MKMLKNLKNKKGFTLIEIVIVIVIIAILAAMLVPSLLKWVDNANKKSFLEAANTVKNSTLTVMTEAYAADKEFKWDDVTALVGKSVGTANTDYIVEGGPTDGQKVTSNVLNTITIKNSKYTVTWTEANSSWSDVGDVTAADGN